MTATGGARPRWVRPAEMPTDMATELATAGALGTFPPPERAAQDGGNQPVLYESLVAADLADLLDALGPGTVITAATVRTARRRTITLTEADEALPRAREALETIRAHGPCARCDADEIASAVLDALAGEIWRLRGLLRTAENDRNAANDALTLTEQDLADTVTARPGLRPWTPDRRTSATGKTISVKRCCNGCGTALGDLVKHDMTVDESGELSDVRHECPICLQAIITQVRARLAGSTIYPGPVGDLARKLRYIIDTGHGEPVRDGEPE